ncbi:sulfurase [Oscillatoriales cyanobacterium USR001]|nr:sulfurase [Oscillatoriales cyanobacterium USR001]
MELATVKRLFTHPIKGLTPVECDRVFLTAGHGIKGDRAFALMFADSIDAANRPALQNIPWLSKKHFAVQNDWPGLAALLCQYEPDSATLTVKKEEVTVLEANIETATGRDLISSFFTEYISTIEPTKEARHPMKLPLFFVGDRSGETRYPDREPVHISLLSQATLDNLSAVAGKFVDVRRFRPNIVVDGVAAWEEFNWIGNSFQLGDAIISVTAKIGRCANIEVNPDTGDRDLPLFSLLQQEFGHAQTGILAKITTSGDVKIGNQLTNNK